MARTAILRYSDVEGPSVSLHEAIAHSSDYVWWGWWKKDTEPFARDLLAFIRDAASEQQPLRIGLLNRKDSQFYAAECIGVQFEDTGTPQACPEPSLCPDYYRTHPLPAWFKIQRFDRLDVERFKLEFGGTPQLDPTLYDVTRIGSDFTINPRPAWTMESRRARGSRILHLSDLHFGDFHGYAEAQAGRSPGHQSLQNLLRERLSRLAGPPIGVVVVTGDLTSRGDANSLPAARELLEDVTEVLQLDREHIVIVPGNHDIWLQDLPHPTRDYRHEKPFRDFLQSFYLREIQDLEWIQRFDTEDWDLTFFTLNSARLRSEDMKEYGYVGLHRYEQMLGFISNTVGGRPQLDQAQLVVAALHHHLLPVPLTSMPEDDRPVSLTLDAGELLTQFQRFGVRLAVHGHQHVPFVSTTTRGGVLAESEEWPSGEQICVVGGGSAGAAMPHLLPETPFNTIGLYTPLSDGLEVVIERFGPSIAPEVLCTMKIPL